MEDRPGEAVPIASTQRERSPLDDRTKLIALKFAKGSALRQIAEHERQADEHRNRLQEIIGEIREVDYRLRHKAQPEEVQQLDPDE